MTTLIEKAKDIHLIYQVNFSSLPLVPRLKAMTRLLAKYYLKAYDAPISLVIAVTGQCQCKCKHCGVSYMNRNDELSLEEVRAVLRDYRKAGGVRAVFTGGEPLMRSDIYEMVSYATELGLGTFLDTNGLAFTEDAARKLKAAGVGNIEFSLDYMTPGKMDENRGVPGIQANLSQAMARARRHGIVFSVNTVGFKENLGGELDDIIAFSRAAGASSVRIVEPVAIGEWEENQTVVLSSDDKERYDSYYEAGFVVVGMVGDFANDCSGLNGRLLNINPDGTVTPCAYMPIEFGNIRRESLAEIMKKTDRLTAAMDHKEVKCPVNEPSFREKYMDEAPCSAKPGEGND
jgi:AdoMet-dependent heme synthase